MGKYNIWALCMTAVVVSFIGFMVENLWLCLTKGYMDNRNMCLPFLIGYGMAMFGILWLLGTPKIPCFLGKKLKIGGRRLRLFLYFLGAALCVCVGEIVLGKLVEYLCHLYWWDYSGIPLHITRYTSVPTSTLFACAVTFFMNHVLEPLYGYFAKWDLEQLRTFAVVMLLLLSADFLYNAFLMYKRKDLIRRWCINLPGMQQAWLKKWTQAT